jgi:uncharacterized membrane protein YjjP (DUF1212 family)
VAVMLVFLSFFGVMLYGAAFLVIEGGGWQSVSAVFLMGVAVWSLYAAVKVYQASVIQR